MATVLFFKRTYSLTKHVAGHKLVLSSDIYDNEKRLRSIWRHQLRSSNPTSPVSLSPTSSQTQFSFLSQSFPTSRLLQLLNNTSSHLSNIAGSWTGVGSQPTNPFAQLVCDQCLKRSTKTLNDYLMDAIKFTKKSDMAYSPTLSGQPSDNPYLVCIYCWYTVHSNCISSPKTLVILRDSPI